MSETMENKYQKKIIKYLSETVLDKEEAFKKFNEYN